MKEKAEVLLEVDRLQTVRDELAEQVASLHAQLEQERSKVRALTTDPKSKDKVNLLFFKLSTALLKSVKPFNQNKLVH